MFEVGDKIVYPMHGAGVIDSIEKIDFMGEEKEYFMLSMPIGDMDISVPADKINEMNIREIISKEEGEKVLEIINSEPSEMNSNWTKRHRENQDILKSGDIYETAEMVRDLAALDDEKGLSTTEKKLLNKARRILASELVMAGSLEKEEAEKMIDESIGL